MKHDFKFSINLVSANVNWMKVHVIQSKNGMIMNDFVSAKNWMIGVLVKGVILRILVLVIVNVIKHVNLMNI